MSFLRRQRSVAKLKERGDLAGLRDRLERREVFIDGQGQAWDAAAPARIEVVEALSSFPGELPVKGLIRASDDDHPDVREAAIRALARIRTADALAALVSRLVDWPESRDQSAGATLTALRSWAQETEESSLLRAPEALALYLVETANTGENRSQLVRELATADGRGSKAALSVAREMLTVLSGPASETQKRAAGEVLADLGPIARPLVLQALAHGPRTAGLVRVAGDMRDAAALELLVPILRDEQPSLRQAAATALGRLRDTRAAAALVVASSDADTEVRDAAAAALDGMGVAGLIAGLASLLPGDARGERARAISPEAGRSADRLLGGGEEVTPAPDE